MAETTPSPWIYDEENGSIVSPASGKPIASLLWPWDASSDSEAEERMHANGTVMAAALELRDALFALVVAEGRDEPCEPDCTRCQRFEAARAALAKAGVK